MRVGLISYAITEESGGPGVAAAGFARSLAKRGLPVTVFATDRPAAHWLIDKASAAKDGFAFVKAKGRSFPTKLQSLATALGEWARSDTTPTVLWVNGIWGPQSLAAAWVARKHRWPYIVRPAGSLGTAALRYKRGKKALYYYAVERHVLRSAASIHCMSRTEIDELPEELRRAAFVVPAGIDFSDVPQRTRASRATVGVLARIHPIKNQHLVLDLVERLVEKGHDLDLELAGSVSSPSYNELLESRVAGSPLLRGRVRFLGHVRRESVQQTVGRWSAALLLSQQENFGHSVIAAAAAGVPSVVSPGVALAPDVIMHSAGLVSAPETADDALLTVLSWDAASAASRARGMAARFSWDGCAASLETHLADAVARTAAHTRESVTP